LAEAAGFRSEDAQRIAQANQRTDEDRATHSVWGGKSARRDYHFTTPQRRAEMYRQATSERSLERFGQFLHAEQDSFSHQRGQTNRVPGTEYGTWIGHAWTSTPDDTWRRPELSNRMAEHSYGFMDKFQKETDYQGDIQIDYEKIEIYVRMYNRAVSDIAKNYALRRIEEIIQEERQQARQEEQEKDNAPEATVEIPQSEQIQELNRP
jgi:hypothetical protein